MIPISRILPVTREHALYDVAQTRALERLAAAALLPHTLMARAGESVARLALALAPHARRVWVAVGPGNNGGDGLEAASHLQRWGKDVTVSHFGNPAALPADAREALMRAQAAGVRIDTSDAPPDVQTDLAIDAVLGIGASRAPQDRIASMICQLNALACPILAVDLPSGLDADRGQPLGGACVSATHTLALLTLKPGLFTAEGRDHAGGVWLDTLGIDDPLDEPLAWLSGLTDSSRPYRRHAQHKGSFGDVAVVGGCQGMAGAALLAARAAHAAGAGRVYVELLDMSAASPMIDTTRPELMFRSGWSRGAPEKLAASTVVCGCGGGDAVRATLPRLLSLAGRLVLDADALNALAADPTLAALLHARASHCRRSILTPHPLEAARLLACGVAEVQADRLRAARELSERFAAIVVLKGSGSVITAPAETSRINSTGNATLATAGTGDVLAGWIAGRWAQLARRDDAAVAFAAACQAVAEHGEAAEPPAPTLLRANDLIERLHARH